MNEDRDLGGDRPERRDGFMETEDRSGRRGPAEGHAPKAHAWRRGMVRIDREGPVALLVMDRPAKLNAMDRTFWPDLRAGLDWIAGQDIRAVILTGSGKVAFSAGGDFASFAALEDDAERRAFQVDAMATFEAVATFPIPIIAAVNGLALGGGCEIAMACDFVLAARSAKFGLTEARYGLVPGYGVLAAPRIVGVQMAKLMIFSGETIAAEEARGCGLAQRLCDDEQLMVEAMRLASAMADVSPHAIAAGKALIKAPITRDEAIASIDWISRLHGTQESRDAVARFLK